MKLGRRARSRDDNLIVQTAEVGRMSLVMVPGSCNAQCWKGTLDRRMSGRADTIDDQRVSHSDAELLSRIFLRPD